MTDSDANLDPAAAADTPAASPAPTTPAPTAPAPAATPEAGAADAKAPAAGAAEPGAPQPEAPGERKRRRRRRRRSAAQTEGESASPATPEPPAGARPRQRPAGERRRRDRSGPRGRPGHHASAAVRALSDLARGLLEVEGVDFLSRPRYMDISVRVPLEPQRDAKASANAVVEQILSRVHEVREHDRALLPGAVYSYFHESSEADGCRPEKSRDVFDGYSSTGKPQFTDFVTLAIERRAEHIDELVDGADIVVTHVTMGRVLRTEQLAVFGKTSPIYRILGQVDAGLFPVLRAGGKAAFSFQLLRGTTLEGKPRLRIHPVGAVELSALADASVALTLSRFQQRLDQESLRLAGLEANGDKPEEEEFVLPLLQDLARQLVGRAKRQRRRTEHASQRAEQNQRPTTKAYDDAQGATDQHIFADDAEGTIIILGQRGRVHVFTPNARHVTSVVMTGSNIQKRRQQGRWLPAEPAERGEFRIALRQQHSANQAAEQQEAKQPKEQTPQPDQPAPPAAESSPAEPNAPKTGDNPPPAESSDKPAP